MRNKHTIYYFLLIIRRIKVLLIHMLNYFLPMSLKTTIKTHTL